MLRPSVLSDGSAAHVARPRQISTQHEVEGVSPKSLPAPDAPHALPPTDPTDGTNEGAAR